MQRSWQAAVGLKEGVVVVDILVQGRGSDDGTPKLASQRSRRITAIFVARDQARPYICGSRQLLFWS
jgi:hypothetical protein